MKQLVILSGKGGTGKTSIAASFAHLASVNHNSSKTVIVDADVDASNLGMLCKPRIEEKHIFKGGQIAIIEQSDCINCGLCEDACRFDAIIPPYANIDESNEQYDIDSIACEGCAACVFVCPEDAIRLEEQVAGEWYRSSSRFGPLFHANLFPTQENSGKLVTVIRQEAQSFATQHNYENIIIDGPPGIGCPVIAASTGVDYAIIVTEPTLAGIHDLNRTLETTKHFDIPTFIVVNKYDLNNDATNDIVKVCSEKNIEVVGQIPFDVKITEAMRNETPVTLYDPETPASQAIFNIWEKVAAFL